MKEKDFQGWIVDTAQRFGWKYWHVPTPMRPRKGGSFVPDARGAGLCDLILIHDDPPRMIFAEVKTTSSLSSLQKEFLKFARDVADEFRCGPMSGPFGVYVWRPKDSLQIETILRSRVML